jgi:hypothetical protein
MGGNALIGMSGKSDSEVGPILDCNVVVANAPDIEGYTSGSQVGLIEERGEDYNAKVVLAAQALAAVDDITENGQKQFIKDVINEFNGVKKEQKDISPKH